jgi:hypothetical protein
VICRIRIADLLQKQNLLGALDDPEQPPVLFL